MLTDFQVERLAGDYNADGVVDAADYSVWRDNVGQPANTLPNDPTGEAIGTAQYNTWRSMYGAVASAVASGGGAPASNAAPEPATGLLGLLLIAMACWCCRGSYANTF